MEKWRITALVLSLFGFLKDCRPSDPFVVQFLNGPWHNISTTQINQDVFPVGTYSFGAQLVITFLVTDYFRYKPLIILSGLAGIGYYVLFIWTTSSLRWLQVAEVLYGTYKAADVAFWSYIYARVDKSCYQKITSYTKSASLVGKFVAAVGSQAVLLYGLVDYLDLNYISLAVQTCTTAFALFLPAAPQSIYFNRSSGSAVNVTAPSPSKSATPPPAALEAGGGGGGGVGNTKSAPTEDTEKLTALELLWFHLKSAYSNPTVLRYSIWYALASCIYYQTVVYIQVLWRTISEGSSIEVVHWNGAVEAALTISGAIVTFCAGFVPAKALDKAPIALTGLSWIAFVQGAVLLMLSLTTNLWVAYGGHVLYSVLYAFTNTLLSAQIAKNICRDSFGLVFGINATVGSVLQVLVTLVVVDGAGLFHTGIRRQYVVYAGVCSALGVLFSVFLLIELKDWWRILFFVVKRKMNGERKLAVDIQKDNNQTV